MFNDPLIKCLIVASVVLGAVASTLSIVNYFEEKAEKKRVDRLYGEHYPGG